MPSVMTVSLFGSRAVAVATVRWRALGTVIPCSRVANGATTRTPMPGREVGVVPHTSVCAVASATAARQPVRHVVDGVKIFTEVTSCSALDEMWPG